ncbi:MAG: glycosyltransferase family 4 protein [candidate division KSB1 bacterium]|nr:glycosyltransferase family 4 protein [candidate division KSB1 bacterium]MDZ7301671.1 glycosyltransferase family 4 protein [candidate division KSB1 bacterium]MDZ7314305.1 glycosyltransferase family 4 protein [candidate division KSB1 bacterium]
MKKIAKSRDGGQIKVAVVPHPQNVFPPTSGSVANVVWESARRLASRCEVTIFSRRQARLEKFSLVQGVKIRRVAVKFDERVVLPIVRRLQHYLALEKFFLFRFYFYLSFIIKTAFLIRRQGCQIIHLHNYSQFAPVIRFFNPHGKIILHMHCHWLIEMDFKTVNRRLRCVDLIISPSDSISEQTRRRFPEHASKCLTVPNGVDTSTFHRLQGEAVEAVRSSAGLNGKDVILFVGRLTPEKGVHVLIEAMATVRKMFPNAILVLAGGEYFTPISAKVKTDLLYQQFENLKRNYHDYLNDLIARYKLEAIFVGYQSQERLVHFYSLATLAVLPSFEEAGPLPVLEAMSCQLPIVATEADGIKDYLPPEAGFLVPLNDAPALAKSIVACLNDKKLREQMGQCGRQWVEAKFTWDRMAKTLLSVYTRLVLVPNLQEPVYEPEYAA